MFLRRFGFLAVLATLSVLAFAGSQYASVAPDWDLRKGQGGTESSFTTPADFGDINPFGTNNQLNGHMNGVDLSITAWSSSLHNGVASCKDDAGQDLCIQSVLLTQYNSGLGVVNGDENDDTPNHSVDNNNQDYDMVLLSFSESVNISNLYTGWNRTYKTYKDSHGNWQTTHYSSGNAGASVMAYIGSDASGDIPFSTTDTWSSIVGPTGWKSIETDTKSNGTKVGGLDVLPVTNGSGVYSKFWLVGAAHSIARDAGKFTDHIKIAGIDFVKGVTPGNPNVPVNAPGILVLLLGCIGFMVARRKK